MDLHDNCAFGVCDGIYFLASVSPYLCREHVDADKKEDQAQLAHCCGEANRAVAQDDEYSHEELNRDGFYHWRSCNYGR